MSIKNKKIFRGKELYKAIKNLISKISLFADVQNAKLHLRYYTSSK